MYDELTTTTSHILLIFPGVLGLFLMSSSSNFHMQLILELGPYIEELTKTGGAIKEFVNPK